MGKNVIRETSEDDIQGIARLRQKIKEFQSIDNAEYISFLKSWINDNPCAACKSYVSVDDQNTVVGHYAMVPFKFLKDGNELLGGFVCQLMVDENFRKDFLFPKMMLKLLREYKNTGVDFAYSLSSRPEVVKAHQSFGFQKIGSLPVYAKPFRTGKIASHFIKNRLLSLIIRPCAVLTEKFIRLRYSGYVGTLKAREIPQFNKDIDTFISSLQKYFPYSLLRNAEVLNWRTSDSCNRKYIKLLIEDKGSIVGYIILRNMKMKQFNALAIVDILFSPEQLEVGRALFDSAHKIAVQLKADFSACLISHHDKLFPILRKFGYYKTPESITLFVHEPKGRKPHFSKDSFDKWHLMWIDHDSV